MRHEVSCLDVLYADLSIGYLDSLDDLESGSYDYLLEGSGLADPNKKNDKWRKVEPVFSIFYEGCSWFLFCGEECLANDV